ncbi:DUF2842 domain-containing protein [Sulfitobacter sp. HNIBRBA3233]|uniref:DUF2842 domain-containing protein n=1 Tax=Sulfitobacter marinivivus TaxID=3158558 RepID=UPI0032DF3661
MALSYKARRRWSLFVLLVGLPVYIVAVIWIIAQFDRPPFALEVAIYVASGVIWAFPMKAIFKGVGQADPDAPQTPDDR